MRDGDLERIDDRSLDDARFIGDATGARVALFRTEDGKLKAFDGERTQLLSSDVGRFLRVQDVIGTGRTFVTTGESAYEIKGRFPALVLSPVNTKLPPDIASRGECCLSRYQLSGSRFMRFPGTTDVFAFDHATGVWRLGENDAERVWEPRGSEIKLSEIAPAASIDGLVFLTMDQRPFRLSHCAGQSPRG